jgi:hypothetical protein
MAKERQKRMGPARSASSMMRSSTRWNGLSTVIDLSIICPKLIPSSVQIQILQSDNEQTHVLSGYPHTLEQWRLALEASAPKRRQPSSLGLNTAPVSRCTITTTSTHGSLCAANLTL